jgi:hypothetical protein
MQDEDDAYTKNDIAETTRPVSVSSGKTNITDGFLTILDKLYTIERIIDTSHDL